MITNKQTKDNFIVAEIFPFLLNEAYRYSSLLPYSVQYVQKHSLYQTLQL